MKEIKGKEKEWRKEGRKEEKRRGRYGNEKKNHALFFFFRFIFYLDHFLKSLLNLLQYYFHFMLCFFFWPQGM